MAANFGCRRDIGMFTSFHGLPLFLNTVLGIEYSPEDIRARARPSAVHNISFSCSVASWSTNLIHGAHHIPSEIFSLRSAWFVHSFIPDVSS